MAARMESGRIGAEEGGKKNAIRRTKKRKPLNPARLSRIALHYLERFAASEASLRRVLENRIRRAVFDDPALAQDAAKMAALHKAVAEIVESHKKSGVINDANFAAMKVHSLRRGGASANRIKEKLRVKGITGNLVDQALTDHAVDVFDDRDAPFEASGEAEFKAAMVLAKKRGLGPFRRAEKRAATALDARKLRQKDTQTLARAGFGFDVIRSVLGDGMMAHDENEGELGDF